PELGGRAGLPPGRRGGGARLRDPLPARVRALHRPPRLDPGHRRHPLGAVEALAAASLLALAHRGDALRGRRDRPVPAAPPADAATSGGSPQRGPPAPRSHVDGPDHVASAGPLSARPSYGYDLPIGPGRATWTMSPALGIRSSSTSRPLSDTTRKTG